VIVVFFISSKYSDSRNILKLPRNRNIYQIQNSVFYLIFALKDHDQPPVCNFYQFRNSVSNIYLCSRIMATLSQHRMSLQLLNIFGA